jgi:hypothetical protein
MRKSKKAGWPKQAPAHSTENRTGQAWKVGSVQVFVQVHRSTYKLFDMPEGLYKCKCGAVVRIDKRGFAFCESCGNIFNDRNAPHRMSNREKDRQIEKLKYTCVNTI